MNYHKRQIHPKTQGCTMSICQLPVGETAACHLVTAWSAISRIFKTEFECRIIKQEIELQFHGGVGAQRHSA
jgi:hypothetical protein